MVRKRDSLAPQQRISERLHCTPQFQVPRLTDTEYHRLCRDRIQIKRQLPQRGPGICGKRRIGNIRGFAQCSQRHIHILGRHLEGCVASRAPSGGLIGFIFDTHTGQKKVRGSETVPVFDFAPEINQEALGLDRDSCSTEFILIPFKHPSHGFAATLGVSIDSSTIRGHGSKYFLDSCSGPPAEKERKKIQPTLRLADPVGGQDGDFQPSRPADHVKRIRISCPVDYLTSICENIPLHVRPVNYARSWRVTVL
jgi:hypothetical protein